MTQRIPRSSGASGYVGGHRWVLVHACLMMTHQAWSQGAQDCLYADLVKLTIFNFNGVRPKAVKRSATDDEPVEAAATYDMATNEANDGIGAGADGFAKDIELVEGEKTEESLAQVPPSVKQIKLAAKPRPSRFWSAQRSIMCLQLVSVYLLYHYVSSGSLSAYMVPKVCCRRRQSKPRSDRDQTDPIPAALSTGPSRAAEATARRLRTCQGEV
jgi:hypothetical protein